jgi:hypothetical protein
MATTSQLKFFIVRSSRDEPTVQELARRLTDFGINTLSEAEASPRSPASLYLPSAVGQADIVGIAIGPSGVTDSLRTSIEEVLALRARPDVPVLSILLPSADESALRALPRDALLLQRADIRKGLDSDEAIADLAEALRQTVEQSQSPDSSGSSAAATKQSPRGEPSTPGDRPTQEVLQAAFDRLTPGARRAFAEAERLGTEKIHMEHLIAGLYRWQDGRTRSALTEADVDLAALARILDLSEADIGPPTTGESIRPIDHLPAMSTHVEDALLEAATIATKEDGAGADIRARHLFYGALGVKDCTPIEKLLATALDRESVLRDTTTPIATTPTPALVAGAPIAGFRSDDADGPDLLDIGDEVEALATVIAAKKVDPPLALGLFGDWGTGKTFFMNKLQKRIDEIAAAENDEIAAAVKKGDRRIPVYCQHIVQLRFNAWHYIDQDLWASLAAAIFDGLDEWITTSAAPSNLEKDESKRAGLLTQQARKRDELEAAERLREESRHSVEQVDESLRKLEGQYNDLVHDVPAVEVMKAVVRIAADQPEIRGQAERVGQALDERVDAAAQELNLKPEALRAGLSEGTLPGLQTATREWLGFRKDWRLWGPIAAAVLVALGIVVFVIGQTDLAPAVRAAGVLVSVLAIPIGTFAWPVVRVLRVIGEARAQSSRLLAEARTRQREALLAVRKRAEEHVVQAEINAAAARRELDQVRVELLDVAPSRQMATFIKRRQASADYRSRLGVVAKARDDFEELTKLLAKQQLYPLRPAVASGSSATADTDTLFAPIDRIVLYIDDLDRCKEADVVAVLQAVHLLLAFRLFVVVVAVDPRWLLHSLQVTSRVLQGDEERGGEADDEDELGWEATPLNYLEKIFQVPYALRPMGKAGFQKMVEDLVPPPTPVPTNGSATEIPAATTTHGPGDGNGRAAPSDAGLPGGAGLAGEVASGATPTSDGVTGAEIPSPTPADRAGSGAAVADGQPTTVIRKVDMNPLSLDISDDERKYMAALHEFIGTPRAAKRFVNVYRLLKASSTREELPNFANPTRHQPILQLLGILTGYPTEATAILRALVDGTASGTLLDFVRRLDEPATLVKPVPTKRLDNGTFWYEPKDDLADKDKRQAERWAVLLSKLGRIEETSGSLAAGLFSDWALPVARYGFESSRILVTERLSEGRVPR